MGISSFLHKSCKSVAHIGSKHRKQAVSAIRVCHQLENLDLPAETPPQIRETIMVQIQQIVQTTYQAVQVAADPTRSVEEIKRELENITPQVVQCIDKNKEHISVDSVQTLCKEVDRFEEAKKQDEEASQKAHKLANRVLDSVPKLGKPGKEHDFYVSGASKRANQQIIFHVDENAKLPEIVWRFQRKYRQWNPRSCLYNPHFYPEVTSSDLEGGVIPPLSDYNNRWTRAITVIGDDLGSRFKLEDSHGSVMYMYEPVKNLTNSGDVYFFKDTKARLYPPRLIDNDIGQSADGLVYCFWEESDKSFIKTHKVRTIGGLVKALNIPAETKAKFRRKAREKSRAGSSGTTSSPGTSYAASRQSTTPLSNDSLTSIELSMGSSGINSSTVLGSPSQTTIQTSEPTSTATLPSSVPSGVVQRSVSQAPSRDNIVCEPTTPSEPAQIRSGHRINPGITSTRSLDPTTPSVALSETIVSSGVTGTITTSPTSGAAGTLKNSTASAAVGRPWWQKWVDPIIGFVVGTRV